MKDKFIKFGSRIINKKYIVSIGHGYYGIFHSFYILIQTSDGKEHEIYYTREEEKNLEYERLIKEIEEAEE